MQGGIGRHYRDGRRKSQEAGSSQTKGQLRRSLPWPVADERKNVVNNDVSKEQIRPRVFRVDPERAIRPQIHSGIELASRVFTTGIIFGTTLLWLPSVRAWTAAFANMSE